MSYTPPTVAPPAVNPWNHATIGAAALDVLRLDATDEDASRINAAAFVATALIDQRLDYDVSPWAQSADIPPPLVSAAITLTIETYRRKDAPFGVTDSWSVDGAVLRLSSDVLRGVETSLAPYRARRGVA